MSRKSINDVGKNQKRSRINYVLDHPNRNYEIDEDNDENIINNDHH